MVLLSELWKVFKKITRWPPYSSTPRPSPGLPYTTLLDATEYRDLVAQDEQLDVFRRRRKSEQR